MSAKATVPESAFRELQALAHERDQNARQNLFEKVCDLALAGGNELEPTIQKLMDEILVGLVRNVERRIRQRLAERLAPLNTSPPELLRLLANDDIDIAKPILIKSSQLIENDLIAIIGSASQEHAVTIARRPRLTPAVGDALIETDDLQVFEALAENQTAALSHDALGALVRRSELHEPLQKPLLARRDLPPEFAHQMFWWVSATLRRFILERFEVDPKLLDQLLSETTLDVAKSGGVALRSGGTVAMLVSNLRSDKAGEFRRDLAGLIGVTEETARRIINDPGGEALAVACRAMGADRSQFTTLILLLDYKRYGRPRPTGHLEQIAAIYDRMTLDNARRTARLWDLLGGQ